MAVTRLLPAVAIVAILAACSSGGSSPSPSPTTAPASPAASAQASPSAAPSAEPSIGGALTVYSGRSESLVGPLLDRFESETGVDVRVEYGDTAELAATILEEGDRSPADVFFAQDAGALGAVAKEGRLAALPPSTLGLVDDRFKSPDGVWVGVSGRARVAAYDSRAVTTADLPESITGFTDAAWKGRIGWAPTNGSFQAFVTAFRVQEGDAAAKAWLEGILANEPRAYDGNDAVIAALAAGEVAAGFVNHYYAVRAGAEAGAGYPVKNHFFGGGDVGALVNVAGAGVLTTAANPTAAQAFVAWLLADESQAYFAEETFEYPLIDGVPADPSLTPIEDIDSPDLDLSDLADLEGTLSLLREAGVL